MGLKEAIEDLKNISRNRVIIVNKKSKKYFKEFQELNYPILDIGFELSKLVENFTDEKKKNEGADILKKFLDDNGGDVIGLDNISYAFSPELSKINIVGTLNYYSRDKQIIILFFDGKLRDNKLIYSSECKEDYLEMDISRNKYVFGWENEENKN